MMKERKLIVIFIFVITIVASIGGFLVTILNTSGIVELSFFGSKLYTTIGGLAFAFITTAATVIIYRKLIVNPPQIELPSETKKMYLSVCEKENEMNKIEGATVKTSGLKPQDTQQTTNRDGNATIYFNSTYKGEKIKINAQKEGYESPKAKPIKLEDEKMVVIKLTIIDPKPDDDNYKIHKITDKMENEITIKEGNENIVFQDLTGRDVTVNKTTINNWIENNKNNDDIQKEILEVLKTIAKKFSTNKNDSKKIEQLIKQDISKAFEVLDDVFGNDNMVYNKFCNEYINRANNFDIIDFKERLILFTKKNIS